MAAPGLSNYRRLVVKVGSSLLVDASGHLNRTWLESYNLLEKPDELQLYQPHELIIKPGGKILLALEQDDVLKIKKEATHDLILQVEGLSKFAGKIGQFRGNRAFKVTRPAKAGEKI